MKDGPTASLEKVEAILSNPAVWALSEAIPDKGRAGRPRNYPNYMLIVFDALISVWRSTRQVEAELSHPIVWRLIRRMVAARFPEDPSMHLPKKPMRRHHYVYGRDRYLSDPKVLAELGRIHREIAAAQAREVGLLDPNGPGSYTHPDLSRMLHADGKVLSALYKGKPGDTRVDKETGEVRAVRQEADAALHFEGDGEVAWGTKLVLVAVRSSAGRMILDAEHVESPGGEAKTAVACFERLAPLVSGAQGVVYDTGLRGVHYQKLLRDLGLLSVNRVTAKKNTTQGARYGRRVEKTVHVEDKTVRVGGQEVRVSLFAQAGAIGVVDLDEEGKPLFTELERFRTHRFPGKDGRFRWYNDYRLPAAYGAGVVNVRLHANAEDEARGFNRTENVRPIPPSDPDFTALHARRNDSESLNRALEDTLFLGRAHSKGARRQLVEVLGWALLVNSLTLARCRGSGAIPAAA